jgi:hypothetical protein
MAAFSWDSPTWGKPGHNVHYAANGSDVVNQKHEDDGGDS